MKRNLDFEILKISSKSDIELLKMFNIIVLRNKRGLSQFELSFLLGQRDLYVRDFERPDHTLILGLSENNTIKLIFNCELANFVPLNNSGSNSSIQIRYHIDGQGNRDYIAEKKVRNGKWKEFLRFGDEDKDILMNSSSTITDTQVQSWINDQYNNGYFNTAKSALQIFLDCETHFNYQVRPLFIARAIQHYTKKKKAPRLVKNRDKRNDYDVFVREKIVQI
ncbi:hypothetical protein [Sphingobacterium kitahiroshimense]|uniref:Uncharacterized protein n=1 Tax=Sphingobacterium kitahiroshimense TaxID=470446 RepID=A0ABV0BX01_9SPHI